MLPSSKSLLRGKHTLVEPLERSNSVTAIQKAKSTVALASKHKLCEIRNFILILGPVFFLEASEYIPGVAQTGESLVSKVLPLQEFWNQHDDSRCHNVRVGRFEQFLAWSSQRLRIKNPLVSTSIPVASCFNFQPFQLCQLHMELSALQRLHLRYPGIGNSEFQQNRLLC